MKPTDIHVDLSNLTGGELDALLQQVAEVAAAAAKINQPAAELDKHPLARSVAYQKAALLLIDRLKACVQHDLDGYVETWEQETERFGEC